ncbi:MAG: FKBP-type peptidyl-prolyl cis-trans isomerase [Bacteroidales bacterium]|nr:FKBP-type peptidyl-prolyl cis-trans isomerase [Bacteroidales bacterium]
MRKYAAIIFCSLFLLSCNGDPPIVGAPQMKGKNIDENMINANKTIAQAEETAIDEYVGRRGWKMEKLSEGARLWEYDKGKGPKVQYEDSVSIHYDIEAINGTKIYSNIAEKYVAGRRQQMIGLDQAVLRLSHGSKAKVILPSSLAYGIGGDGNRIPQSTILVIDVTIE